MAEKNELTEERIQKLLKRKPGIVYPANIPTSNMPDFSGYYPYPIGKDGPIIDHDSILSGIDATQTRRFES